MPRLPKINYWKSRKGYWTQIDKHQHELARGPDDEPDGPTFRAAQTAFNKLFDLRKLPADRAGLTVDEMVRRYVAVGARDLAPESLIVRERRLKPFVEEFGELYASSMTPRHVSGYVAARRERKETTGRYKRWSSTTACTFLDILSAVFGWAIEDGIILENPVSKIARPKRRSRGRESVLTAEDNNLIFAASSKAFREVAEVLSHTGARPGEIAKAQACDWDDAAGCLVYHSDTTRRDDETGHKTSKKNRTRRIFFTGKELDKMRVRVRERPTGCLFRTRHGNGWTSDTIARMVTDLKARLDLPFFTAYSWRHTFCTEWIKAGKSIEVLAELMGNTPDVIRRHYSHLDADISGLRKQLEAFRAVS